MRWQGILAFADSWIDRRLFDYYKMDLAAKFGLVWVLCQVIAHAIVYALQLDLVAPLLSSYWANTHNATLVSMKTDERQLVVSETFLFLLFTAISLGGLFLVDLVVRRVLISETRKQIKMRKLDSEVGAIILELGGKPQDSRIDPTLRDLLTETLRRTSDRS